MRKVFIAINLLLLLAACEPENPGPVPVEPSREEIISRTWTIKEAKENGTATTDFNGNTITFNVDKTFKAVSPFETVNGTWHFNSNKSHVIFNNNAKPEELLSDWEILELTDQRFRWRWVHNQESIEATMEP
jgi:hypothetical protein